MGYKLVNEMKLKPILHENFSHAYKLKYNIQLHPSICVYSEEKYANTICYVLQSPVKYRYTLGYLPDDRPECMEQARISYTAIINGEIKKAFVPVFEREKISEIRCNK